MSNLVKQGSKRKAMRSTSDKANRPKVTPEACGVDATAALGHSSSDVTRKSYIDPSIVAPQGPADVLFNPLKFDKSETQRLPAPTPEPEIAPEQAWL
jgi:hypothetical protein